MVISSKLAYEVYGHWPRIRRLLLAFHTSRAAAKSNSSISGPSMDNRIRMSSFPARRRLRSFVFKRFWVKKPRSRPAFVTGTVITMQMDAARWGNVSAWLRLKKLSKSVRVAWRYDVLMRDRKSTHSIAVFSTSTEGKPSIVVSSWAKCSASRWRSVVPYTSSSGVPALGRLRGSNVANASTRSIWGNRAPRLSQTAWRNWTFKVLKSARTLGGILMLTDVSSSVPVDVSSTIIVSTSRFPSSFCSQCPCWCFIACIDSLVDTTIGPTSPMLKVAFWRNWLSLARTAKVSDRE